MTSREASLHKLNEALHEPMVAHNWPEALRVLQNAGQSKEVMDIVWKVGYELICKESDQLTRSSLMRDFYSKMKKSKKCLTKTKVTIDYISFCLKNGDLDAAKSVCQKSREKSTPTEDDEMFLHDQLQAYHGLVFYLEWQECLREKTDHDQTAASNGSFTFSSQEQTNKMQAKECASKAIRLWTGIEGLEGTWDSFIEKYIQVLLYCETPEVAVGVLQRYTDNQPTNICAQKLLYQFYIDHPSFIHNREETIVKLLRRITELNPADPLVLKYCKYEKDDTKIIGHLFTLLDYLGWQQELKPWKMMAKYLESSFINKDNGTENVAQALMEEWTHRQTWWPSYHFTEYNFHKDSNELKLIAQKYITAAILCRKETDYTKLATKKLTEGGYTEKIQKITGFIFPKT